jgi:hypothetical protein
MPKEERSDEEKLAELDRRIGEAENGDSASDCGLAWLGPRRTRYHPGARPTEPTEGSITGIARAPAVLAA